MKDIYKLSDLFDLYLLGRNGNEDLLENLVNATLTDFNFEEVKDLEIIDPFNLSDNIDLKESIIDIKAKTKDNKTVIIEFQLSGNIDSENLELIENDLKEANPIMTKVIEEYKRFTSDDKMMRAYAARDAFLLGQKMMLSRERKEGKLEGIKERNYIIAKNMKEDGADINLISKYTGLSIEEIEKL